MRNACHELPGFSRLSSSSSGKSVLCNLVSLVETHEKLWQATHEPTWTDQRMMLTTGCNKLRLPPGPCLLPRRVSPAFHTCYGRFDRNRVSRNVHFTRARHGMELEDVKRQSLLPPFGSVLQRRPLPDPALFTASVKIALHHCLLLHAPGFLLLAPGALQQQSKLRLLRAASKNNITIVTIAMQRTTARYIIIPESSASGSWLEVSSVSRII